MKARTHCSWNALCPPLARSTLMRWLSRLRSGQPLWRKPGPKKVRPADGATLLQDLRALCPGRCRTRGTGSLYRRYARWLSRRELAQLARALRQNQLDSMKHIHWLKTGLAWSIDATEYGPDGTLIVPVQDLASRYRLPAFAAPRLQGPAVANHLHRLFQQFGPPLFLKRDNGSPFNHHLVDALLARYCVLPLNNPPHFPRYNGAMERGISELKRCLNQLYATQTDSSQSPNGLSAGSKNGSPHHSHKKQMRPASNTEADFSQALPFSEFLLSGACNFSLTLENTLHHLNHKNRRSLQGRTACACFHDPQQRLRLTKRQRQLIFRLLCQRFWQRVKTMTPRNHQQFAALWRQTVESWLRCQGLISVRLNKKVSTILPNFLSHN